MLCGHCAYNFVLTRPCPYIICKKISWCGRYVESGVHAGFAEALDALNQQEVMDTITKIVRTQAIVGVTAAVEEGM